MKFTDLTQRSISYLARKIDYLFKPVSQIFDYDAYNGPAQEQPRRVLQQINEDDFHKELILTTYFTSKADPQKKIFMPNDDFSYIGEFYSSVLEHDLYAVIFYDNLSKEFVEKHTCDNIKFVKCRIIKYSLNDERFFIYREFLKRIEIEKIILADVNDVTFGKNPFEMIQQDRFYIGRDHHALVKGSEWIQNKLSLLPQNIKERIPVLFGNMPLVNAGVIGGDARTVINFVEKVAALLAYADNNNNNNMACVNIAFFDSYWLPYHKNPAIKLKYLRNQDIKKLTEQLQISSKKFLMGKPFTSHFWKFEKGNASYIYHK